KALLVVTDGNDSESKLPVSELRRLIRQSEVLVYTLGIDGTGRGTTQPQKPGNGRPRGFPFPPSTGGGRGRFPPVFPQIIWGGGGGARATASNERVNPDA